MDGNQKLSMPFGEKQAHPPSQEQVELISKWVAIFSEHYHREISELGMATYIEGLKDMTPTEIQIGFERALFEIPRMPTVADVREGINQHDESVLYRKRPEIECKACSGTGWKDRGDGKYVRCVHDSDR